MGYTIIIHCFPTYLILFETLFRSITGLDFSAFIGPSLAAAGLSLLIPLVRPKPVPISDEDNDKLKEDGYIICNTRDERLIVATWIAILVGIFLWSYACSTALNHPNAKLSSFWDHSTIGMINYICGITFSTYKDAI